jgi:[ribosomal protein S5]-alanine N-acetyltransferase
MKNPFLIGNKIYLRNLELSDLEGGYVSWFNDAAVCKNNSHHIFPYTRESGEKYINQVRNSKKHLVLAIVQKSDDLHVGNISLQNINYINRSAEFAVILGEKSCYGKGYMKDACSLVIKHGFLEMNLHRIYGGTLSTNILSRILINYLGMKEEGCRRDAAYKNGKFVDAIEYSILKKEFLSKFNL